jgi:hypothetical protein
MKRARTLIPIAMLVLALASTGARASAFSDLRGHLGFGYTKLFADDAPGGSMAVAAGLDLPVAQDLRAGIEAGVDLLGSTAVERGSLFAELDYSVFEVLGLIHWTPPWNGPLGRISVGPGLFKARADLSSAGPAAFEDLPVLEWAPGASLSATLISRKERKVNAGVELGTRWIALSEDDWILATARVVIHY